MSPEANKKTQGPPTWLWAHAFADAADADPRDGDEVLLERVLLSMRCDEGNAHTTAYINNHPPKYPLKQWVNEMHTAVNARLGKPDAAPRPMGGPLVIAATVGVVCAMAGFWAGRHARACTISCAAVKTPV